MANESDVDATYSKETLGSFKIESLYPEMI